MSTGSLQPDIFDAAEAEVADAPITWRGGRPADAEDFVKRHVEALAAKLAGDQGWLYEQWPLATLLADLRDVGVELRIPERQ